MSSETLTVQHERALKSMGFPEADVKEALRRTNNDINHAVELLSSGNVWKADDAEFDLIAAAAAEPAVREPTVFHSQDHKHRHPEGVADPFMQVKEGKISEMVDSRISTFTEMGFTTEQAEAALKQANGDVNVALNILTGGELY